MRLTKTPFTVWVGRVVRGWNCVFGHNRRLSQFTSLDERVTNWKLLHVQFMTILEIVPTF